MAIKEMVKYKGTDDDNDENAQILMHHGDMEREVPVDLNNSRFGAVKKICEWLVPFSFWKL